MLDWKINEENASFSSDAPEPARRTPFNRKHIFIFLLIVIVLASGGAVGLWWRAQAADAQMRDDLLLFIRREEQARRFGLVAQAEQFAADDVPETWFTRYAASFALPPIEPLSVTISIVGMKFQNSDALVEVQMGRQVQERRYRQTAQGWRRVPLGESAQGDDVSQPQDNIVFQYSPADSDFATDLMSTYPDLIDLWGAWGGELAEINRVSIQNGEFQRPAYVVETTLNVSVPKVITLPAHWDFTGEEAARYWVAREMGTRIKLGRLSPTFLPGNSRFVKALVTVTSLRWAMADEPYRRLVATWSDLAATHRGSSFYDRPNHSQEIDPFAPTPQEAAALLMADTLYTQGGNERIAHFVRTMQGARQWDAVFAEVTGVNTLEFETLARGGPIPTTILEEIPVRGVPIAGNRFRSFQLQVEGYEQPIWVETNNETKVFLSDGREVAVECATAFPEVEIEGQWYESGLRLEATRIVGDTVSDAPSSHNILNEPAPVDTLFYFARAESDPEGNEITQLIAVNDNTLTPVWSRPVLGFSPMYNSFSQHSMPLKGIAAIGFASWDCDLRWLLHYDPTTGREVAWFFPLMESLGDPKFLWDEGRGLGMVVLTTSGQAESQLQYALLELNKGNSEINFVGTLPLGEAQLMRPGRDEVLIYDSIGNQLLLYDWTRDLITWQMPSEENYLFGSNFFDPTGRYLYLTITALQEDPTNYLPFASKIVRYDLESGESDVVWNEAQGGIAIASIDANGTWLYAIARLSESGEVALMHYKDGQWHALFRQTPEDPELVLLSNLRSCGNGGAFMIWSGNAQLEGAEPLGIEYYFVSPEGDLAPAIIPLKWSEYPISC